MFIFWRDSPISSSLLLSGAGHILTLTLTPKHSGCSSTRRWHQLKAKQELPLVTKSSRSFLYDHSLHSCQSQPWVTVVCRGIRRDSRKKKSPILNPSWACVKATTNVLLVKCLSTVTLNAHIQRDEWLCQQAIWKIQCEKAQGVLSYWTVRFFCLFQRFHSRSKCMNVMCYVQIQFNVTGVFDFFFNCLWQKYCHQHWGRKWAFWIKGSRLWGCHGPAAPRRKRFRIRTMLIEHRLRLLLANVQPQE